ncbi:MAG: ABC transporter ATP-binding protein [Actinomycetota bacterium]
MLLELTGVEKHFGGLPAVDGVDLRVDEGEIVALVGPNGAGKSTLLKAISGMQPATRGSVRFDGEEIAGLGTHRVRRRGISMALQHPRVFESLTVRENVVVGATFGGPSRPSETAAVAAAEEALDFVGLGPSANLPVGGLNLHQKRFLELARALVGGPRLLLLDEVMAGLNDAELEESIAMVRTARDERGLTVIWVEHVMKAVVSLAERVVVLNFGRTLADGPPTEVMQNPEVVVAYLGTDLETSANGVGDTGVGDTQPGDTEAPA